METVMSDKKEIATLSIKITVDSTDLDKLEAQLKSIEGLMISTGLKQPAKQGFTMDFGIFNPKGCLEPVFTVSSGTILINEACIEHATIEKIVLPSEEHTEKTLASSVAVLRASKAISTEQSAFEKLQQLIEDKFNYLHSSITAIQHAQANSEIACAGVIEQVRAEIQRKEPLDL